MMRRKVWIFPLCMLVASIVFFSNADAEYIGSAGGEINAGNGCTFVVPPDSIGSDESADVALTNADEILVDLNDYLESLVSKKGKKGKGKRNKRIREIQDRVTGLRDKIGEAKGHLVGKDYSNTHKDIKSSLAQMGIVGQKLEANMLQASDFTAQAEGELLVAQEAVGVDITAMSHQAIFEYNGISYTFLVFEFGPSGTTFNPHAMLIVPWNKIIESDWLILHLGSTDIAANAMNLGYDIDYENETVIFYIPGFSHYYFTRR